MLKMKEILKEGLQEGIIKIQDILQIDFENETEVNDEYDAMELLMERGIGIKHESGDVEYFENGYMIIKK